MICLLRIERTLMSLSGYPPADHSVRDYLTCVSSKDQAYDHASAFFGALFIHTAEVVSKFDQSLDYYGLAREFRKRMTEGQKMTKHNEFREEFFEQVVAMAITLKGKRVRQFRITFLSGMYDTIRPAEISKCRVFSRSEQPEESTGTRAYSTSGIPSI
jgi:hypothetical protein